MLQTLYGSAKLAWLIVTCTVHLRLGSHSGFFSAAWYPLGCRKKKKSLQVDTVTEPPRSHMENRADILLFELPLLYFPSAHFFSAWYPSGAFFFLRYPDGYSAMGRKPLCERPPIQTCQFFFYILSFNSPLEHDKLMLHFLKKLAKSLKIARVLQLQ